MAVPVAFGIGAAAVALGGIWAARAGTVSGDRPAPLIVAEKAHAISVGPVVVGEISQES